MERLKRHETIIYGGAFNPPTLAHVAILQACIDFAEPRQSDVWVMPSGTRTDKIIETSRQTRLDYIAAMIADTDKRDVPVAVNTTELDQLIPTETYDTVSRLRAEHEDRDFRFVFGADSTETMGSWHGGDELLETLPMLVVGRHGSVINPLARCAVRLDVIPPEVSSTEVRRRQSAGELLDGFVSPRVRMLL